MLQGIAIGDLHYDKLTKLFGEELGNKLITHELNKALSYAKSNGIPHVFLMGDTAHKTRMSHDAHKRLLSTLHKYDKFFNIHIILGNHDWDEEGKHSMEIIKHLCDLNILNTKVYTEPTQEILDDIYVNFLPHPYKEAIESELPSLNFGHFDYVGSIRDNGTVYRGEEQVKDPHNKYVLGHLHTPQESKNRHVVGTLYQTNFGESLPKSFTEFTAKYVKGKLVVDYIRINNEPKFKLLTIDVKSKNDLKSIEDNPYYLYKLVVDTDFELEEDWLISRPNVVKHNFYSSKQERDLLLTESLVINDDSDEFDTMENIVSGYLKANYEIEEEQISSAINILNNILTDTDE